MSYVFYGICGGIIAFAIIAIWTDTVPKWEKKHKRRFLP